MVRVCIANSQKSARKIKCESKVNHGMKKYNFSFDVWGLAVFLIIMMPNCIWFAVPAPNDVLRAGGFITWELHCRS